MFLIYFNLSAHTVPQTFVIESHTPSKVVKPLKHKELPGIEELKERKHY